MVLSQEQTDALVASVTEQITLDIFDPENHEVLRQLVEGMGDPRGMMRLRVAETLGEIGEPAVPFLLDGLANHENPVVRRAAAKTLTLIADPSTVPHLLHALLNDQDTVVRGSAVGHRMLLQCFDGRVSPTLSEPRRSEPMSRSA